MVTTVEIVGRVVVPVVELVVVTTRVGLITMVGRVVLGTVRFLRGFTTGLSRNDEVLTEGAGRNLSPGFNPLNTARA